MILLSEDLSNDVVSFALSVLKVLGKFILSFEFIFSELLGSSFDRGIRSHVIQNVTGLGN